MRVLTLVVLGGGLWLGGCKESCPEGTVEGPEGTCVAPTDTDPVDTDPVLPPARPARGFLTLTWQITQLPSHNKVELICGGRSIFSQESFTARKEWVVEKEIVDGTPCEVRITDSSGGPTAGGKLVNCTKVLAEWPERRGADPVVASVIAEGCKQGCADPVAENYDPEANQDDGTCQYIYGCTDERARNYNPLATKDDRSCDYGGFGIVELNIRTDAFPRDTTAVVRCGGYDIISARTFTLATTTYYFSGILDAGFDCEVVVGDLAGDLGPGGDVSVCGAKIAEWSRVTGGAATTLGAYEEVVARFFMTPCSGCTDPLSPRYDETAMLDDGSCYR